MPRFRQPKPTTIDFETYAIQGRPHYPPEPVGVSIKRWNRKARYYGWGHPSHNNSTKAEAKKALKEAYRNPDGILFQNAKFDTDVAEVHFGIKLPAWHLIHDTMYLLFLDDPHQKNLSLKPSSERLLDWPPEEQDAVAEWLVKHQPVEGARISKSPASKYPFGAYIAFAPGDIVGKYANGDVDRTEALFKLLYKKTVDRGMLEAYQREQELMPVLLEMERQGLPVDLKRLREDVEAYEAIMTKLQVWIVKKLQAPDKLNLNSGAELMQAMIDAGVVDLTKAPLTPTGKYQTNKEALLKAVTDKQLLAVLQYRAQLSTCLNTFMVPWLRVAEASGGFIYTTWNQVKSPKGKDNIGTRTGRLSSTPNFQNIPNHFRPLFAHEKRGLPRSPIRKLRPLPEVRSYIVPFKGHALIDRDYCFSPDTEVLTEDGFVLFKNLGEGVKVAQWASGEITYDTPLAYQKIWYKGDMVCIAGKRSTNLLMTPNHNCLIYQSGKYKFVKAENYPTGTHGQQLHAGIYEGSSIVDPNILKLAVAIQADASNRSHAVIFYLKKERKIKRLDRMLKELRVEHVKNTMPSKPGFACYTLRHESLPESLFQFIDLSEGRKQFKRELLQIWHPLRLVFLKELGYWDGTIKRPEVNWSYTTTHIDNANLVQEMACITGLRALQHTWNQHRGKACMTVSMRINPLTYTKTFSKELIPYEGYVYCVTMPQGTVIVKRNGKVSITGNSQQEIRILAHYDNGSMLDQYKADPWLDFHDTARQELANAGKHYDRKPVKNTNFGLIYGMGIGSLAERNETTYEEAKSLKNAILGLYPGIKSLFQIMRNKALKHEPLRTWGRREYYCEDPKIIQGRTMTFDYKMVNVLIQGSAADCTKQAIINFAKAKRDHWKIVLNVHDQITVSVPKRELKQAMAVLTEAMESVDFALPMLTEGSTSTTNWAELKDYDKHGDVL